MTLTARSPRKTEKKDKASKREGQICKDVFFPIFIGRFGNCDHEELLEEIQQAVQDAPREDAQHTINCYKRPDSEPDEVWSELANRVHVACERVYLAYLLQHKSREEAALSLQGYVS